MYSLSEQRRSASLVQNLNLSSCEAPGGNNYLVYLHYCHEATLTLCSILSKGDATVKNKSGHTLIGKHFLIAAHNGMLCVVDRM